jgi:signal transduction histidine kinase
MTHDHKTYSALQLHLSRNKIVFRLGILVAIEVLLVVSVFGISTYIESQSTAIGNTINIAGKNRYLTSNFLLELEKVNQDTAHIENLRNATDALNTNILFLRSGGQIVSSSGDIFLTPLSSKYLDKWYEISEKGDTLNHYVGLLGQGDTISPISNTRGVSTDEPQPSSSLPSSAEALIDIASIETTASQLIASSDELTHQLSEDDRIYSQNFVSMQTIFIIGAALLGALILYIMNRLLRPISLIIKATEEVKKGNLSIAQIADCDRQDEVGVLVASFNSMIKQLAEYEERQRDFINIAAHELRTPIQPILGLSATLREEMLNLGKQFQRLQREEAFCKELQKASTSATVPARPDSTDRSSSSFFSQSVEKIILMADVMNRNAKRLEKMTSNLLDLSRIENDKPLQLSKERFDLGIKIQNVINDICSTSPDNKDILIRFESNVNKNSIMIEGDKGRIFEVISNLLNNAIKFTEKGEVAVILNERDGQAIVSIRDTGTGIAPEIYPKLFTKFATKSEKGTGLGLFLAKNIVESHGGKIWAVNNSDGNGATFAFSMPVLTFDNTTETRINEKKL